MLRLTLMNGMSLDFKDGSAGALFAEVLGNNAVFFLTVSFTQMLRASKPAMVFVASSPGASMDR